MDFKEVCDLFGGSIFPEEVRGNLAELSYRLSQPPCSFGPQTITTWACENLLRAIWHALSGHTLDQFTVLAQLISQPALPRRWLFRAHAHRVLFLSWFEHPACFRFCSLTGSPAKVTSDNGLAGGTLAHGVRRDVEACKELMQFATQQDIAEFHLFNAIYLLPSALDVARGLRPIVGKRDTGLSDSRLEYVQKTHQALHAAQNILDKCGLVSLSAYIDRLFHELAYAQGLPGTDSYIESMRAKYIATGDFHGLGIIELVLGNMACSTPFTSPIVLNMYIRDGWDDFGGDSSQYNPISNSANPLQSLDGHHVQGHPLPSLTNDLCSDAKKPAASEIISDTTCPAKDSICRSMVQDIFQHYESAKTHFERVGSARGVATATLYEACLRRLLIMAPVFAQTNENHIAELYYRADFLFMAWGDILNFRLAQAHRVSTYSETPDRLHIAYGIGRWAAETGNDEFVLYLGLFILRVARHAKYMRGQIHEARHQVQISMAIFDSGSRKSTALLQSLALETECLIGLGDHRSALRWLNNMNELSHNVVLAFKEDLRNYPEEMLENHLLFRNRVFAYQHHIKQVCNLAISIYPCITKDVVTLKDVIGDLMDRVTELDFFESTHVPTSVWLAETVMRLHFAQALVTIDTAEPLITPDSMVTALSESLDFVDDSNPVANLLYVEVLNRLGLEEMAAATLMDVGDHVCIALDLPEDLVSEPYLIQREVQGYELLLRGCIQTKQWQRGRRVLDTLEKLSPGYFTDVQGYTKVAPWERCLFAGLVMEGLEHHELALRFLAQSKRLYALNQLLWQAMSETGGRLVQLQTGGGRLANSYVRILLKMRDEGSYEQALEPFRSSRINSRTLQVFGHLSEYLIEDPEYEALAAVEADKKGLLMEQASSPLNMNRAQLIRDQYRAQLLLDLRSLPRARTHEEQVELTKLENDEIYLQSRLQTASRLRDWHQDPDSSDQGFWERAIANNSLDKILVILISVDEDGLALFGITNQGIYHVSFQTAINTGVMRSLVNECLHYFTSSEGRKPWAEGFESLALISAAISIPLEDAIETAEHTIFISSGDLTRFPFSTLVHRDRHLGIQKAVSQAPSLYNLLYLMARNGPRSPLGRFCAVAKPGKPSKKTRNTDEVELPMAGIESMLIALLLGTKPRNAQEMTREDMMKDFESCDWLHLGTHGSLDADAPFHSSLSLKDKLRVIDLLAVQSTVKMVVFSACFSGLGKATDRGDNLGFSHAVLAAGANAFIGALWHTHDLATLVHMYFFYWELLNHRDKVSIATVWQRATYNLYHLDQQKNNGVIIMLDSFINGWDAAEELGFQPGRLVKNGRRKLEDLKEELTLSAIEIDFKHPYFWAPFIVMGNGEQYIMSKLAGNASAEAKQDETM